MQQKNNFSVNSNIEITIEANPDDISLDNLLKWKKYGINRISLGVQTLNDNLLNFINRSHDKKTAVASIKKISEHYDNFSIDLIYGIPGNRYDKLKNDIKEIIKFNPPHISAYNLSIEKKTVFYNWLKNNKWDIRILGSDWKDKKFTGHNISREISREILFFLQSKVTNLMEMILSSNLI